MLLLVDFPLGCATTTALQTGGHARRENSSIGRRFEPRRERTGDPPTDAARKIFTCQRNIRALSPAMDRSMRYVSAVVATVAVLAFTGTSAEAALDRIPLQVNVDGTPVRAVLDTGAVDYVLFRSAADRLNLKVIAPPPDIRPGAGQTLVGLCGPAMISLLGAEKTVQISVVDDPPGRADTDLLIGWSAIRNNIWEIRLPRLRVTVRDTIPEDARKWKRWRIGDQAVLFLENGEESSPRRMGIDSGLVVGVALFPDEWQKLMKEHSSDATSIDAYFTPAAGVVVRPQLRVKQLALGDLVLSDVMVGEADSSQVSGAPAGTIAILGIGALNHMEMVLDGTRKVAYLDCIPSAGPGPVYNRLGAVFVPAQPGDSSLVAHVAPRSPAAVAGVRAGDILLKIDDRDTMNWREWKSPPNRMWQANPGTSYALKLKRGQEVMTIHVKLEDFLKG